MDTEDKNDATQDGQPLYVLWWTTLHLRWWDEDEVVEAYAQGKFADGTYDYFEVAQFHARVSRYGGRFGGRVRRDPATGCLQVQDRVRFGYRGRPVVLVCTTSPSSDPRT